MASWALGRSSGVDSRRAYTSHLGKTITGDLDRCRGPIRSPFSRKTDWPSGLGCCHQMFSAVISFGDAWATRGHLLSVVPFLQALSGTGMKGLVFPKDCKQKQISKMHWGWPRWSLVLSPCPIPMPFPGSRHLLTVSFSQGYVSRRPVWSCSAGLDGPSQRPMG